MSKTDKLLSVLRSGQGLTAKQIASRFRVANPYDLIYKLRVSGFDVELFTRVDTKGRVKQFYKLLDEKKRKRAA